MVVALRYLSSQVTIATNKLVGGETSLQQSLLHLGILGNSSVNFLIEIPFGISELHPKLLVQFLINHVLTGLLITYVIFIFTYSAKSICPCLLGTTWSWLEYFAIQGLS